MLSRNREEQRRDCSRVQANERPMGRRKSLAASSRQGAAGQPAAAHPASRRPQLVPLMLGAAVLAAAAMLVLQPQPALGFTRPDQRESCGTHDPAWQGWFWESGRTLDGRVGVTRARARIPAQHTMSQLIRPDPPWWATHASANVTSATKNAHASSVPCARCRSHLH